MLTSCAACDSWFLAQTMEALITQLQEAKESITQLQGGQVKLGQDIDNALTRSQDSEAATASRMEELLSRTPEPEPEPEPQHEPEPVWNGDTMEEQLVSAAQLSKSTVGAPVPDAKAAAQATASRVEELVSAAPAAADLVRSCSAPSHKTRNPPRNAVTQSCY